PLAQLPGFAQSTVSSSSPEQDFSAILTEMVGSAPIAPVATEPAILPAVVGPVAADEAQTIAPLVSVDRGNPVLPAINTDNLQKVLQTASSNEACDVQRPTAPSLTADTQGVSAPFLVATAPVVVIANNTVNKTVKASQIQKPEILESDPILPRS